MQWLFQHLQCFCERFQWAVNSYPMALAVNHKTVSIGFHVKGHIWTLRSSRTLVPVCQVIFCKPQGGFSVLVKWVVCDIKEWNFGKSILLVLYRSFVLECNPNHPWAYRDKIFYCLYVLVSISLVLLGNCPSRGLSLHPSILFFLWSSLRSMGLLSLRNISITPPL